MHFQCRSFHFRTWKPPQKQQCYTSYTIELVFLIRKDKVATHSRWWATHLKSSCWRRFCGRPRGATWPSAPVTLGLGRWDSSRCLHGRPSRSCSCCPQSSAGLCGNNGVRTWKRIQEQQQLTDDVQISRLGLGLGRVDLTEITASISFLDVIEVQVPRPVVLVRHWKRKGRYWLIGNERNDRILYYLPLEDCA